MNEQQSEEDSLVQHEILSDEAEILNTDDIQTEAGTLQDQMLNKH